MAKQETALSSYRSTFFRFWNWVLVREDLSTGLSGEERGHCAKPRSSLRSWWPCPASGCCSQTLCCGSPVMGEGNESHCDHRPPGRTRQHLPLSQGWKSFYCPTPKSSCMAFEEPLGRDKVPTPPRAAPAGCCHCWGLEKESVLAWEHRASPSLGKGSGGSWDSAIH